MELFKGKNLIEFAERFNSDERCLEYLAFLKWSEDFVCTKCSHAESATANILFHKVKFGIQKAFFICFEMSTSTKSLSANYVADRFGVTEKTARFLCIRSEKQ